MKRFVLVVVAVAALCAALGPAAAQKKKKIQIGRFAFVPGAKDLNLVKNKGVQADLDLSKAQVKQIADVVAKSEKALENLKGRQRFKKMRELAKKDNDAVKGILNPKQSKRLAQLKVQQKVQQRGANAFFDPKLSKALDITKADKDLARKMNKDALPRRRAIQKDNKGKRKIIRKKIAELNRILAEDFVRNLTPKQQTKWKEMAGKPYKGLLPLGGGRAFGIARPGVIRPIKLNPKKIKIRPIKKKFKKKIKIKKVG